MKLIPDPTGRFAQRPFYEGNELDIECERTMGGFLRSLYGKVSFPVSTDDLTKLIEQHVSDFDSYADLTAAYGDGVEGVTEFLPRQRPTVRIHQDLTNDAARENRLRTTLTHELGHVLFHTWLFDQRAGGGLFPSAPRNDDKQVCKRENILDAPQVDWMEWQAGHACGALLMPASHVRRLAKEVAIQTPPPSFGDLVVDSTYGRALVQAMCARFQVSSDAAQVRAHRLKLLARIDFALRI
ncbi:ImmA/IrrE family metallo-endopeptidase [Tahibacter amnicola]|uniref:ImmA/IrrE family metallo-endopeptidase n=1 Tax=Tahibacter amnicola TaxID=2976241 RepID=A0ABY6B996_9GAMM|nr:ImmA/IrrE family metallo-endopeptidase [Tahibacter amnicola]UXI66127.1 ImmA/IrrE family metallo-endopeptidase [Tahibacter amnicola]